MTYEPLTTNNTFQVGDRISLNVDEAGEKRDGFFTEFEDGGFWIRFDDDIENEDFIDYRDQLLAALESRPMNVITTHPELKPFEQMTTELQYRVYQGFTIEQVKLTEKGADAHIQLIEDGQTFTQTLRSTMEDGQEHVRYI